MCLTLGLTLAPRQTNADTYCPTREDAIVIIAHKADVERGGRVDKRRVWAIADRESGLDHCRDGRLKVGVTGDYGLFQFNPWGVWRNCQVNVYCNDLSMIADPYVQVDVILNYYERYGDFCPWNPAGNYLPGCGYK